MNFKSSKIRLMMALSFALVVMLATIVTIPSIHGARATGSPTIASNQADYAPGATVNLTGAGWASGEDVQIYVNDSIGNTWSLTSGQNGAAVDPVADDNGGFTYSFSLPSTFIANYTATAKGPTSGTATTTFTDASVNLDQFANLPSQGWQNGDLNGNNSAYQEGRVVPFRLAIDGLNNDKNGSNQHTIHLNYDFTGGGHEAYDFLASYNATESPDVCSSVSTAPSSLCPNIGAPNPIAFPADPFAPGGNTTASKTVDGAIAFAGLPRLLSMWHGNPVSFSTVTHSGNAGSGDSSADLVLTFNTGTCTNNCSVLLAWGGHIAQSAYWTLSAGGGPNGAGQISGSSFHMRTQSLDTGGNQNQDKSMKSSAIVTTLTVNKHLSPTNDPGLFNLLIDGTAHASNVGNLGTTGAVTITAGTHTVSETAGTNTNLSDYSSTYSCVDPQGKIVASGTGTSLSVNVISGINVTCTFTNTRLVPSLQITKTADAGTVNAGDPIGYTITVTNNGTGTANNVTVKDTLPTNGGLNWSIALQNPANSWSISAGVLSFGPATLAPGASATVHITSPTTSASCGTVNNSASVTSSNAGSPSVGPVPITVNCASLQITKTADAGTVNAGDTIGYTITVTNNGTGTANNVTVKDTLPTGGLNWSIALQNPANSWSISAGVLSFGPATLAPGASATVHITSPTTSATCGTVNNSASVTSSNDGSPSVGPVPITVNCASIKITKTADKGAVSAGDQIGYTITVSNTGAGTAHGVTVSDKLPTNTGLSWSIDSATSDSGWSISAGVLTYGPADLAAGASVHVHITSPTTSATCGTVSNTASVSTTNDGSDQANASITVNCASIQITKVADADAVSAGDTIGYVITVSNSGAGTAHGVTVSDTLPKDAGTSWSIDAATSDSGWSISAGVLSYGPADLAAGASVHVHIISPTTSDTCGTVKNSASATTTNDGNPSVGPVAITVNCASIQITKNADAPSVSAGDQIGYVIIITNTGTGIARKVTVTDTLPSNGGLNWTIDSQSPANSWSINNGVLSFGPLDLAPGASAAVHITSLTTSDTCGTVTNSASATSSNDGSSSAGPVPISVNCASIKLTKTADADTVSAGDQIGYTITVSNTGDGIARKVTVSDTPPSNAGLTWSIDSAGTTGTWTLTSGILSFGPQDLAPGASYHVHITSPTTSAMCGTVNNSASATTTNDGNPSVGPVAITVNCAKLEITKTADADTVSAGDQIGYTITVSNTGDGTARTVTVSDTVPTDAGLSWSIEAAGTTGTWTLTGGTLSFGPQDLAPGASYHVHITSPTTSATCGTVNNSASATTTNDGNPNVGPVPISVNCAKLEISKTADDGVVSAGDTIGYTITISNTGDGIARNVKVSDTLPTNGGLDWSIDSQSPANSWSISNGVLSFGPLDLAHGASATVHITSPTTSATCGTVNNSASVTSTNDDGSPSVGPVAITVNCANLQITKTADADTVSAGDQIGYTITVSNTGDGIARNVTVKDTLPTGGLDWTIDSQSPANSWSINAGVLSFGPLDLAGGDSATVHITSPTTSASCGTVNNSASATTTNDGNPSVGPVPISVNCAKLEISKKADDGAVSAGDTIGYVITVSNSGTGIARNVTVSDTVPTDAGLNWSIDAAGTTGTWTLTGGTLSFGPQDLAPGASVHVHITSPTTSDTCGTVSNSASVSTTNAGSDQASASITVNCANIQITKVADDGAVSAGDQIGYVITVTNSGAGIARNVKVSDTLPTDAGTSWSIDAATSDIGWSISAGVLSYGPADLAAGDSVHVHITSPTTSDTCGTVNNSASATTTNDGSPSVGPVAITVNCASIQITKTADASSVSAGDQIGYVIIVTNTGAGIARKVTVTDTLPSNGGLDWTIDSQNPANSWSINAGVLSFGPLDLGPGASAAVHITSPTTSATCGVVDNSASVSTTNAGSSQASASITVNCASIKITKVADAGAVNAGDQIGYVVTVSNSGAGIARNVKVSDTVPTDAGTNWSIDAAGTTGTWTLTGGTLSFGPLDLAGGDSVHVHITSPTTSATCGTVNNSASATTTNDGSPSVGPVPISVNCGSLQITKMLNDGGSGFTGKFTIHYDCVGGPSGDVSVAAGDSATVNNIPTGSVCTVTEPTPPPAPTGYSWGTTVIAGSPATIGTNTTATVTVKNVLTRDTGSLQITKTLSGGPQGFTGPFSISYSCSLNGTVTKSGTVQVSAGGSATVSGIPTGSVCTVTEPTSTLPTPPNGYSWGTPVISGSPTAAITKDATAQVTVKNVLTRDTGSLQITKTLSGGPKGFSGPFTILYDCGNGLSGNVSLVAGGSTTIPNIPTGSSCTVTEPTLPTPPTGYSWGPPVITGSPAAITTKGTTVTVTVENRLQLNTGALTIGYWQNKNGQGIITGQAKTGPCLSAAWLTQFNPFKDLSSTADCSTTAAYVLNIIKTANASGSSMNAMLKAQMLATALDVYFSDPTLGGNQIKAPAPIGGVKIDLTLICKVADSSSGTGSCSGSYYNVSSAFGGANSLTVLQMLQYMNSDGSAFGNGNPVSNAGGTTWYLNVKATQEMAKNAFDAINNQVVFGP